MIGQYITLARKLRGMSQRKLSKLSGVSQSDLSKVENGLIEAHEDMIAKIAPALDLPEKFFYQTERLYGLPMSVHK